MKLSTKTRYGLRALLSLAEQEIDTAVSVRQIAESENVSSDYLEHLLHAMKKAGLVQSIRGAGGGFKLAKSPKNITLKDVFCALNEKIEPVWCLGEGEKCPRKKKCKSRPVWDKFNVLLDNFLSATTLEDAFGPNGKP